MHAACSLSVSVTLADKFQALRQQGRLPYRCVCALESATKQGMDYAGQKLAEQINLYILAVFAILAFGAGYAASSFALLLKIYAAGLLLDAILVLPDWPWFNREPLQWLPAKDPQIKELEKLEGKRS